MAKYWPKIKIGLTVLLIGFLAVSCSNKRSGGKILVSNCPAVGVIDHLNSLTRFDGQAYTNQNVVFDAFITDVETKCSEGSSVSTNIDFSIRAKKGPASNAQTYNLTYYVVIIRDNYQITNKQTFTTQVRFAPGQDTAAVREHIVQSFASFEDPRRYDYEVLIGFEVSPDELEFNVVRQQISN